MPPVVRPPTDGGPALYPDHTLLLSASQLETYEDCPLRYFYEYVLRVRADSNVYAELGSLVHEVLAAFLDADVDDVDYSLGWGLGNGFVVGVGGHLYRQIADDKQAGASVGTDGNRARSLSIGPSFKYDSGKGWFVTAKWQKEGGVRNRAEGNALWVKAVFPL